MEQNSWDGFKKGEGSEKEMHPPGGNIRGIMSVDSNEENDPQDISYWNYWNGDEYVSPDDKNDIIVKCIQGM